MRQPNGKNGRGRNNGGHQHFDNSGHLSPEHAERLLSLTMNARDAYLERPFFDGARAEDTFAEELGEGTVLAMTSGEDRTSKKRRASRSPKRNYEPGWQVFWSVPETPLQLWPGGQSSCSRHRRRQTGPAASPVQSAPSSQSSCVPVRSHSSPMSESPQARGSQTTAAKKLETTARPILMSRMLQSFHAEENAEAPRRGR
jgi:hypothetical protein